jgi:hypothetical protein
MPEHRFLTKEISKWLARSGLTLDSLQRLSTTEQGRLGREWKNYRTHVETWQKNSGLSDDRLELYSAEMPNDVPSFEGAIPPPPQKPLTYEEWNQRGNEAIRRHTGR